MSDDDQASAPGPCDSCGGSGKAANGTTCQGCVGSGNGW